MLFDFYLRPLEEVHPWGEQPNLSLSWFGFTDGFYRLKVGSEYLLNYSHQFVQYGTEHFPDAYRGSFTDYYVVRLWEDVLTMLPDILEPLPVELVRQFEENGSSWLQWRQTASAWSDQQPDNNQSWEIFDAATSWQSDRFLDAGYLRNAPRIWFWSTAHDVTINWDNTGILFEGIPVWSASQGTYRMARHEFLDAVRTFHEKLMREMGERVEHVCDRWHHPDVHVDTQHLRYEQQDRQTWLDKSLAKPSNTCWNVTLDAIHIISTL